MNRPTRLVVIAAAVGGLALTVATVAVAVTDRASDDAAAGPPVRVASAPLQPGGVTSTPDDADRTPGDAALTREEAVAIAEQGVAEQGVVPPVHEVEWEFEHGRDTWKVEFGDDREVYVDAATGEVVKLDLDDDRDDRDEDDDDDRHDDRDDRDDD